MTSPLTRIVLILPLIWVLSVSVALGASNGKVKKRKRIPPVADQNWGSPVAELGTPDKNIQVFRLTQNEQPEWTYMVVRVDEDGSHLSYGTENTVGLVLEGLNGDLKPAAGTSGRCPAAAGWRFESKAVRVSYCSESGDTRRIERAVGMLEIASTVETK